MNVETTRLKIAAALFREIDSDPKALETVLKRAGLKHDAIEANSSGQTSVNDARFIREATSYLDDPTFGARAGLTYRDASSLTAYITRHSRTLRTAVQNSSRFHAVVDPKIAFSLRLSDTCGTLELEFLDAQLERYHRYAECILFGVLARTRNLIDMDFYPLAMRFRHPAKSSVKELERLAGCPIEFGAETMGIDLSHAILEMPIPTYDPDLRNHLMEYGERLLRERPASTPTLRKRIERILMNSLPGRIVSADEVAGSLGLSRRTFARRLADDGFSYREVVDDLRGDLAKTYLAGGFSIAEIAFLLDYADQAAFSTAFKRWTGKNPSQFRDTAHGHIHH